MALGTMNDTYIKRDKYAVEKQKNFFPFYYLFRKKKQRKWNKSKVIGDLSQAQSTGIIQFFFFF
jgi:hypothetical protein